ncbi:DNA polymerase III subunit gamma/tau C-terminal domain-containing protein [Alkalilimnicola ehrlichii]|uniref:DNA polymerase III subunit gamma/tau C-terminal domain-containing protein n=1 Tax=Alkalilimnicola ehrlichii TaxID=351052 RepID=UPI0028690DE9|nr:DNA polymerase III subunit gamma/tau C-terminal domain-containing protein [Alkalilimnicola ehrlichii]
MQFNLKRLPAVLIAEHLQHVLDQEGLSYEQPALATVAQAADGSMRDALSLLDQAIAFGSGEVREQETRSMLGSIGRDFLFDLLDCLAAEDGEAMLKVVGEMGAQAPDYSEALAELLTLLHTLALAQTIPSSVTEDVPQRERLLALAERLAPEDVQLFYQIALIGRRDLPLAPDPRIGFEMVLLRMLAFRPQSAAPSAPRVKASPQAQAPEPSRSPEKQAKAPMPAATPPPADAQQPVSAREAPAPVSQPVAQPAAAASADGAAWFDTIDTLALKGPARALAMQCEWVGYSGGKLRLRLDPNHQHLRNPALEQRLAKALGEHYGEDLQLEIEMRAPEGAIPAQLAEERAANRRQAAVETINQDPNVAAMRDTFGAEVINGSIEPID